MSIPPLPELVAEFLADYLPTPQGQKHLAQYALERKRTRDAFLDVCKRADAGEDITERVLTQLLPHNDSPFNRERGAWCSTWPVITREIKAWFEGAGWVEDPSQWPNIANAILRLLRALDKQPDQAALEAFANSEESRGFRAGFLSPALHCIRPDLYCVINSKSLSAGNHCLEWFNVSGEIVVDLKRYIASNALLAEVIRRLHPHGIQDGDHFDMWSHWLLASRLGGYLRHDRGNSTKGHSAVADTGDESDADTAGDNEELIAVDDDIPAWIARRIPQKGSLRNLAPGARMQWTTSTNATRAWLLAHADVGDLVFFYEATPAREIVGLGTVSSPVRERNHHATFEVECMAQLAEPISLNAIKREASVSDLRRIMTRTATGSVLPVPGSSLPGLLGLILNKNPSLSSHPSLSGALHNMANASTKSAQGGQTNKPRDLASYVTLWRKETGYPNDDDRAACTQRDEWAKVLSRNTVRNLDVEDFRPIFSTGVWGSTGPQASLNTFFRDADDDGLDRFRDTLALVLHGDGDIVQRLDRALDRDSPQAVSGLGESVLMKCLALVHPDRFVGVYLYRGEMGKAAFMELLGLPELNAKNLSPAELAVRSNDAIRDVLAPHFPDVAGVPGTHGMRRFLYWLLERAKGTTVDTMTPEDVFVERTALPASTYRRLVELLEHRRQIVLYGPPGTGKTHVAEALAGAFGARVERVQFHPAYGYEDFIEGLRPVVDKQGQLRYEHKPGVLKALAERARAAPGERFVLIIDEINRASMARVFGELLYLLEYRGQFLRLASSGEPFDLPTNLYLIGTMNTADRSIAQIDLALRRRFHFHRLDPDVGLLERQLTGYDIDPVTLRWAVDGLKSLNEKIEQDRGIDFTIGHTYFLDEDLDERRVERVLLHNLRPLLEDLYADTPHLVKSLVEIFERARPAAGTES